MKACTAGISKGTSVRKPTDFEAWHRYQKNTVHSVNYNADAREHKTRVIKAH